MGDAYHYHSGSSRMTGLPMVAGNMIVNNVYYGYEQNLKQSGMAQKQREFILKKALNTMAWRIARRSLIR